MNALLITFYIVAGISLIGGACGLLIWLALIWFDEPWDDPDDLRLACRRTAMIAGACVVIIFICVAASSHIPSGVTDASPTDCQEQVNGTK